MRTWKKRHKLTLWSVIVIVVALIAVRAARAQTNEQIVNAGFELPYNEQGAGPIQVPHGWAAWWEDGLHDIPGIQGGSAAQYPTGRPEYKAATLDIDPHRVRSGGAAAQWFNYSRTGYAGLLQRVNVEQGARYAFSVWAQCWSGDSNDPTICPPDRAYISLGIDPDGGTWIGSRAIVWTQWSAVGPDYVNFDSLAVDARKDTITLFVSVAFKWALRHNDVYLDDAALQRIAEGTTPEPCPTAIPCPSCPTPEPCAPGSVDYARIKQDVYDVISTWDTR